VELKLTKEQAEELDGLLDGYLKHLEGYPKLSLKK